MEYGKLFSLYLVLNSKGLLVVIGVHKFEKALNTNAKSMADWTTKVHYVLI